MTKVIYSNNQNSDQKLTKNHGTLECSDCPKDVKHEEVTWFSNGDSRCSYHLEQWRQKVLHQRRPTTKENNVAKATEAKAEKESKRVAIEDRAKEAGLSSAEVSKLTALYKKDPKAARKQLRRLEQSDKKEAVTA
jgi:hypothetical protein